MANLSFPLSPRCRLRRLSATSKPKGRERATVSGVRRGKWDKMAGGGHGCGWNAAFGGRERGRRRRQEGTGVGSTFLAVFLG